MHKPDCLCPICKNRRAKAQILPKEATSVPLMSLLVGAQFEYGGEWYRRLEAQAGKIVVLHLTNPELGWVGVRQVAFDPNLLVIKK